MDEYDRLGLENNLALKQKRENYGVQLAKIRTNMTELMYMEVQERLNLEIISAWYELEAAHKAIDAFHLSSGPPERHSVLPNAGIAGEMRHR